MNSISNIEINDDFLLERDLFDFVDDLENFQSRHKKKKDFLDKKPNRKELLLSNHKKLVLTAYRRNYKEIPQKYRDFYYEFLKGESKAKLIDEITNFNKLKTHKSLNSFKF